MLLCDPAHLTVSMCECADECEIDWYPGLSVAWLIDVQSKHCSFACMPLEGGVNEASVARSPLFFVFCFFIVERERTCNVCAQHINVFSSLTNF